MFTYRNPVELIVGNGALSALASRIDGRPYALLTHGGPVFAAMAAEIENLAGAPPLARIDTIADNPDLANLQDLCADLAGLERMPELLVALGGGSVIDACKVLSATRGDFARLPALLAGDAEPHDRLPYLAIPTTAGTGSEVTCWATVWDRQQGRKHSLSHPRLYACSALLEPRLTASLPWTLTVSTALDALSHSLESLWNRNRNPISTVHATAAARRIVACLPRLRTAPQDLALRGQMQLASLHAGLAFSNTQTSLAHNISYAITLDRQVSHGVACSITLPMLVRAVEPGSVLAEDIARVFDAPPTQAAATLERFFDELGVATDPREYGYDTASWLRLLDEAAGGARGRNFSGDIERLRALYLDLLQPNGTPTCTA